MTSRPTHMDSPTPADKFRFIAPPVVLIAIVSLSSLMWYSVIIPELPDPLATHFGINGVADGFTSVAFFGIGSFLLGLTAAALLIGFAASGMSSGWGARAMAGSAVGTAGLMSAMLIVVAHPQRGLETANGFVLPGWHILTVLALALILGTIGALISRPLSVSEEASREGSSRELPETTRAVWFGRGVMSRWALFILVGFGAFLLGWGVIAATRSDAAGAIIFISIGLVVIVPGIAMSSIRVRVDDSGITWSFVLGFPRSHIPYARIKKISATNISPGEWGGWGYRLGPQGTAILLRKGEALRIERTIGADLFITVDDADRAAALAQALHKRQSLQS